MEIEQKFKYLKCSDLFILQKRFPSEIVFKIRKNAENEKFYFFEEIFRLEKKIAPCVIHCTYTRTSIKISIFRFRYIFLYVRIILWVSIYICVCVCVFFSLSLPFFFFFTNASKTQVCISRTLENSVEQRFRWREILPPLCIQTRNFLAKQFHSSSLLQELTLLIDFYKPL